jgi:hypothetical protein
MQLDHSFTTQVETEYKKTTEKGQRYFQLWRGGLEIIQDPSESENYHPSLTDLIKLIQCPSSTVTPSTLSLLYAFRNWYNSHENLFLKVLCHRKGLWPFV